MRSPEGWWKPEAPRGCGGGGHSPREAWKRDPRISRGRAAARRAGRSHPFLKEAPSSPRLPPTPPLPPPQVTAPPGDRGPAAPEKVGAAPPLPRGAAGQPGGMGFGSAPSPEAENRGLREPQRGSGGGVLPAAEPCSAAAPAPERPGRGAASRAPAGALPERGAVAGGVPESPPANLLPAAAAAAAAVPSAEPLRLPPAAVRIPSFDRCALRPPPPAAPSDTQAFCCRGTRKRPQVWPPGLPAVRRSLSR